MTGQWNVVGLGGRAKAFVHNHRDRLLRQAVWEIWERAYRLAPVRASLRPFVPLRKPEAWLFPVGCYNSGTTLLLHILGAHPDVRTLPDEGVRFTSVLHRPEELGWTRMWARCPEHVCMPGRVDPPVARRVMQDWSALWGRGGRVFMDKSISNTTRMTWLDLNFPHSHFIGMVRNGYCVASGIRSKARPKGTAAREIGDRYPIALAGEQWVVSNRVMMRDAALVARFRLLRYEDLVSKPLEVVTDLWNFVGLPVPRQRAIAGGIEIEGRAFAVEDMNAAAMRSLAREDVETLAPILSKTMAAFGYSPDRP